MLRDLPNENYKERATVYGSISNCYFEKGKNELNLDKVETNALSMKKSLIHANCSSEWFEKKMIVI